MTARGLSAAVILVACAACVARPARATPNFPGAIQRDLGASQPPLCSICHLCGTTGRGTVNTPWGMAMRSRGLMAYDEASLATALAAMERDRVDSDGDGVVDVDAVRMGQDPNPSGLCDQEDDTIPRYGCIGRLAAGPPSNGPAAWLLAAALILGAKGARFFRNRGGGRS
jgi:hypothetical protein